MKGGRIEIRACLSEQRGGAGCHGGGDARAAHRGEARVAVLAHARVRRDETDAGRHDVGLGRPVEREAAGREWRVGAKTWIGPDRRSPDRELYRPARGHVATDPVGDRLRHTQHGDVPRSVRAERARGNRSVHEDGRRPRCCSTTDRLGRHHTPRQKHRAVGDVAVPPTIEVALLSGVDCDDLDGNRVRQRRRAAERLLAVEQNAETGAEENVRCRRPRPLIVGCNGERRRGPAWSADRPEGWAGRPVVPNRRDDECVERLRAGARQCKRPVGEGGVGLDDPDERDPGGVVSVTVRIGVDGRFDPRKQLVGSPVHRDAPRHVGLPARDADWQDRRPGRDAMETGRPVRARDEPGQLGGMGLEAPG